MNVKSLRTVESSLLAIAVLLASAGCGESLVEPFDSEPHITATILSVEPVDSTGLMRVEIDEVIVHDVLGTPISTFRIGPPWIYREKGDGWVRVKPEAFQPGLRVKLWLNGATRGIPWDMSAAVLFE